MDSERVASFTPAYDGPTNAMVAVAEVVIEEREKALSAQKAATLVQCTTQVSTGKGCGDHTRVADLVYHQDYDYVEPYGCSGGDIWVPAEAYFLCPGCGHRNRLYCSPAVVALKDCFADVLEHRER